MLEIKKWVGPSPEQWEIIIEGMRNPMNSWGRMDSDYIYDPSMGEYMVGYDVGDNDHNLMTRLANGGPVHAKYRRMINVFVTVNAPMYWWKEFDTYKVGTVCNSCSTMHKIQEKKFTVDDFSHEHLTDTSISVLTPIIGVLNTYRWLFNAWDKISESTKSLYDVAERKQVWWQMIQLLPNAYNQTRTIALNYEVLHNMYISRKDHKLDEWRKFCEWIVTLPYNELITG